MSSPEKKADQQTPPLSKETSKESTTTEPATAKVSTTAADTSGKKSLFERSGGKNGVAHIVDELVNSFKRGHTIVEELFGKRSAEQQKEHKKNVRRFITREFGGENNYVEGTLIIHGGQPSAEQLAAVDGLVEEALRFYKFGEPLVVEMCAVLHKSRGRLLGFKTEDEHALGETLFEKKGGKEAIAAVVEKWTHCCFEDRRIYSVFEKENEEATLQKKANFKKLMKKFLTKECGGPNKFGDDYSVIRQEKMGQEEFITCAGLLGWSCRNLTASDSVSSEIVAACAEYSDHLVEVFMQREKEICSAESANKVPIDSPAKLGGVVFEERKQKKEEEAKVEKQDSATKVEKPAPMPTDEKQEPEKEKTKEEPEQKKVKQEPEQKEVKQEPEQKEVKQEPEQKEVKQESEKKVEEPEPPAPATRHSSSTETMPLVSHSSAPQTHSSDIDSGEATHPAQSSSGFSPMSLLRGLGEELVDDLNSAAASGTAILQRVDDRVVQKVEATILPKVEPAKAIVPKVPEKTPEERRADALARYKANISTPLFDRLGGGSVTMEVVDTLVDKLLADKRMTKLLVPGNTTTITTDAGSKGSITPPAARSKARLADLFTKFLTKVLGGKMNDGTPAKSISAPAYLSDMLALANGDRHPTTEEFVVVCESLAFALAKLRVPHDVFVEVVTKVTKMGAGSPTPIAKIDGSGSPTSIASASPSNASTASGSESIASGSTTSRSTRSTPTGSASSPKASLTLFDRFGGDAAVEHAVNSLHEQIAECTSNAVKPYFAAVDMNALKAAQRISMQVLLGGPAEFVDGHKINNPRMVGMVVRKGNDESLSPGQIGQIMGYLQDALAETRFTIRHSKELSNEVLFVLAKNVDEFLGQPLNQTLFEKLGGSAEVEKIVDRISESLLCDPRTGNIFRAHDAAAVKDCQRRHFSRLLGGPDEVANKPWFPGEPGGKISAEQYDHFLQVVREQLRGGNGVGTGDIGVSSDVDIGNALIDVGAYSALTDGLTTTAAAGTTTDDHAEGKWTGFTKGKAVKPVSDMEHNFWFFGRGADDALVATVIGHLRDVDRIMALLHDQKSSATWGSSASSHHDFMPVHRAAQAVWATTESTSESVPAAPKPSKVKVHSLNAIEEVHAKSKKAELEEKEKQRAEKVKAHGGFDHTLGGLMGQPGSSSDEDHAAKAHFARELHGSAMDSMSDHVHGLLHGLPPEALELRREHASSASPSSSSQAIMPSSSRSRSRSRSRGPVTRPIMPAPETEDSSDGMIEDAFKGQHSWHKPMLRFA